jgi:hypothetical protein
MKVAQRPHNGKHGKRPELSATSTTILAQSEILELLSTCRKTPPNLSTSFTKSRLQGRRQIGRRNTRGLDSGQTLRKLQKLSNTVRNSWRLSNGQPFSGSLAGPVFYPSISSRGATALVVQVEVAYVWPWIERYRIPGSVKQHRLQNSR